MNIIVINYVDWMNDLPWMNLNNTIILSSNFSSSSSVASCDKKNLIWTKYILQPWKKLPGSIICKNLCVWVSVQQGNNILDCDHLPCFQLSTWNLRILLQKKSDCISNNTWWLVIKSSEKEVTYQSVQLVYLVFYW